MKKNITLITLVGIFSIYLTACGGGGGGSDTAHFKDATEFIEVTPCEGLTVEDYTVMKSGDILVQDVDPTTVTTYHDEDDTKSICVESGQAHLIRE